MTEGDTERRHTGHIGHIGSHRVTSVHWVFQVSDSVTCGQQFGIALSRNDADPVIDPA